MKKTVFRVICIVFALIMSVIILSACNGDDDLPQNDNDNIGSQSNQGNTIYFKTLTVGENNSAYGKLPNGTSTFSFLNEIDVRGTAGYSVYLDIICSQEVKSKTVSLTEGDNTFYIWAENTDSGNVLYTVTVRVKPMYEVAFDTKGGTSIEKQMIEEDACAKAPTTVPTKTGYNFAGWDFDFSTPITGQTTISANWSGPEYILTVVGNGGTSRTLLVTRGETIDVKNISTRDGYEVAGIYSDVDMSEELTTMPAEDITAYVHWVGENKAGDFNYTTSDDGVTVTGYKGNSATANIPLQIGGKDVIGIARNAFKDCTSLTSVTIPDKITSIGMGAFHGCSSLVSMSIPVSVTYIDADAFHGCEKLIQIDNGVYYVDKWVIDCNTSVANVTLRNDTLCIGRSAFYGCENLKKIIIPNSVTSIGGYAFYGCIILDEIIIPNSVTNIGTDAFCGCVNLDEIIIPNSVTSVGSSAFRGCEKLIQIEEGVSYVDKWVIDCNTSVVNVTLRNDTIGISDLALSGYINIESITLPDSVTIIGANVLLGCASLTEIIIPNSVTRIGIGAFSKCTSLTDIYFDGTVEKWKTIEKGLYWDYQTGVYTITCTDGKIAKDGTVTML